MEVGHCDIYLEIDDFYYCGPKSVFHMSQPHMKPINRPSEKPMTEHHKRKAMYNQSSVLIEYLG
jgi:hypothetical protein